MTLPCGGHAVFHSYPRPPEKACRTIEPIFMTAREPRAIIGPRLMLADDKKRSSIHGTLFADPSATTGFRLIRHPSRRVDARRSWSSRFQKKEQPVSSPTLAANLHYRMRRHFKCAVSKFCC